MVTRRLCLQFSFVTDVKGPALQGCRARSEGRLCVSGAQNVAVLRLSLRPVLPARVAGVVGRAPDPGRGHELRHDPPERAEPGQGTRASWGLNAPPVRPALWLTEVLETTCIWHTGRAPGVRARSVKSSSPGPAATHVPTSPRRAGSSHHRKAAHPGAPRAAQEAPRAGPPADFRPRGAGGRARFVGRPEGGRPAAPSAGSRRPLAAGRRVSGASRAAGGGHRARRAGGGRGR